MVVEAERWRSRHREDAIKARWKEWLENMKERGRLSTEVKS